ncbi:hypothetical protein [Streptomyces sp. C10-9-1]|uniref:hypothetical protein n=1 Tax=Streptomyces sp. C10-9-1 TaxID=1859285 RepID=UPI003F49C436
MELVSQLAHERLFDYSPDALSIVDEFLGSWGDEVEIDLIKAKNFILLAAAEYALIPFIQSGKYDRPVSVQRGDALLAVLKCDTTPMLPVHRHREMSAVDLSVFSSDIAKLDAIDSGWWEDLVGPESLWRFVERLERAHSECPWMPLRDLSNSSLLRIQGLLWELRLTVAKHRGFDGPIPAVVSVFARNMGYF